MTWALERSGRSLARVTRFLDPNYYRTYPEQDGQPRGFMSVQQEVTRALARAEDFADVPATDPDYRRKTSGLHRDTIDDAKPAFVVRDRSYVSARWPGDAHTFARTFAGMLNRRVCPLCHQRSPRRTRLLVWLSVVLAAARYDGIAVTTD